ncbi:MAG: phosphocholine cytidylyltransferase family protein [Myxococcales bacterium]|nr:phosphocholine cytidylyltransferase family protein [Myxococcales bacterium]
MRAIIIAAGQGSRLRPHTDDRPKTMVEVADRPLLHHQLAVYRRFGVTDVVVIGGYKRRSLRTLGARVVPNHEYLTNNILMSLFCAGPRLVGDVLVSYGDIIFTPKVLERVLETPLPGVLAVDRMWAKTYEGRTDHPIEQAELCRVSPQRLVTRVGKSVGPEGAYGEFIGLARFSGQLLARLWGLYLRALDLGDQQPYGDAPTLRKAYLTDLINDAVAHGEIIGVAPIAGGWREIDTVQDLARAREVAEFAMQEDD